MLGRRCSTCYETIVYETALRYLNIETSSVEFMYVKTKNSEQQNSMITRVNNSIGGTIKPCAHMHTAINTLKGSET